MFSKLHLKQRLFYKQTALCVVTVTVAVHNSHQPTRGSGDM